MTQVLQQRCLPPDMAQQPHPPQACHTNNLPAHLSVGERASCIGGLSAASDVDRVLNSGCPLPTFSLAPMLALGHGERSEAVEQLCQAVATCLRETGCLVISDPRVKAEDNMAFLDMMERYFAQSTAAKMRDTRPDLHFQVSINLLPNQPLHVQRIYTGHLELNDFTIIFHDQGMTIQHVLPFTAELARPPGQGVLLTSCRDRHESHF